MWAALRFGLTGKIGIDKRFASHLQAMSLIPSESYSFPDHFTRTVVPSPKPKNEEPEPVPLETRRKRSAMVPLPDPEVRPPTAPQINLEPIRSKTPVAAPNPALRRRWNTRAPAVDHPSLTSENGTASVAPIMAARNSIPMNPTRVARPPRVMPPPRASVVQNFAPGPLLDPIAPVKTAAAAQMQSVPAKPRPVAVSNREADFFAMLAQTREIAMLAQTRQTALSNQRQKMKFHRFIVCECAAFGALLALAIIGLSFHPTNAAVAWIINIFAIASAVTAALIPIIFYAFTPTLPEIER
jgi:hypothetical protein